MDLNGLEMNAIETADNGVINADTIFKFGQTEDRVWASYSGGLIERGFLVGIVKGKRLEFRYCQIQKDGALDGGQSDCEIRLSDDGLIQIVEEFEWESRIGGGTNIIQQIRK